MKGLMLDKFGAAFVIWSSALLAQTPTISHDPWELITKFGLPTVLTIALCWGWYKRDQRMERRTDQANTFIQNRLVALVEDSSVSKREVASAMKQVAEAIVKCPGQPPKP